MPPLLLLAERQQERSPGGDDASTRQDPEIPERQDSRLALGRLEDLGGADEIPISDLPGGEELSESPASPVT